MGCGFGANREMEESSFREGISKGRCEAERLVVDD